MAPCIRQHRAKMHGMKTDDECKAYVDRHHAAMVERAKQQGRAVPAMPAHDPCAHLEG